MSDETNTPNTNTPTQEELSILDELKADATRDVQLAQRVALIENAFGVMAERVTALEEAVKNSSAPPNDELLPLIENLKSIGEEFEGVKDKANRSFARIFGSR